MAPMPRASVRITVMENEAFKAAIQTNIQSGDIPDLFQSWGGGGLRDQVKAGYEVMFSAREIGDGGIYGSSTPVASTT